MKITVLSDGSWGTALATVLCNNGHNVTIWGPFPDYLDTLRATRINSRFLPDIELPEVLTFEADMATAVADADILLLAAPTQYARMVLEQLKPVFNPEQHALLNVAKGIENDTQMRISEICRDVLGECRYAILSGPSHAEEVARQVPTAVVTASNTPFLADTVQEIFMNSYFRVYTCDDVIGLELGGALKNIMAIAAGVIDGMELGDNPKAALITRGIAEMSRLGVALGGKAETFSGLSGIGDLIVTCTSGHSRNRHVGEELGRGKQLDAILAEMGMVVAEGVKTTSSIHQLLAKLDIETPIVTQIYQVLYENKNVKIAISELMNRKARPEMD
ncbi:MAG: NAD(P)H-dependent glycerol-3-phosphate dehydrogenase [Victivallaceae bacterium]|nr:NAD(P)H-dependent glycerol-3-phosphate dehydrogenase [Victivallaceae bacterium]